MSEEKTNVETTEEVKTDTKTTTETTKEVKVPAKFADIVKKVEEMSVLELNELVKVLEEKFGVSASSIAVAGPVTSAGEEDEAKSTFTVELTSAGEGKIAVMKVVKEILTVGLKEAKELVDAAPSVLKEDVKKEEAEELKKKIEEVGGQVTLK